MVCAIHKHQSTLGIHMSPPFWTPLSPPSLSHSSRLSQCTGFGFPVSYIKLPLAICLTYGIVCVSVLFSHIIPFSPSLTVSKMSVSPLLPCKSDHQCCLSTLHACMPSLFSRVWLFATLWTVARQTPLFMRFSRHKYWSGLHFLLQGIFPDPGIKLASPPTPAPKADSLPLSHWGSPLDSMLLLLSRFNRVRLCATP